MYIKVKVLAGAKKEAFIEKSKDRFEVSIKEPAKQNLANKRVVELIASHFQIPKEKVKIISGHHSPSKMLSLRE